MNQTKVNGTRAEALFGKALMERLNKQFTHQFRCGFLVEQSPEPGNRVTLSEDFTDGLGLPRPQISYDLSDYTRKGFVAAYQMKNLLFDKMGINEFTSINGGDPTRFDEEIDGKEVPLALHRRRPYHGHLPHGRRQEAIPSSTTRSARGITETSFSSAAARSRPAPPPIQP